MPFDGTQNAALEHLLRARALIEDPKCWRKRTFRLDRKDHTEYCAVGALMYGESCSMDAAFKALDAAALKRGYRSVITFNDAAETKHADVLALYDEAIALC